MPYKIFVSYHHSLSNLARGLTEYLISEEVAVWHAEYSISLDTFLGPVEDVDRSIDQGIREAEYFLAIGSGGRNLELERLYEYIRIGDMSFLLSPSSFEDSVPRMIAGLHRLRSTSTIYDEQAP